MVRTVLGIALAGSLAVALALPAFAEAQIRLAEAATKDTTKDTAKAKDKAKPPTAQQQKMKDCNAKWTEEKANTGAKGRTAYRKFLSECLKAPAT
jgi:psiF repeat-containing protein